MQILSGGSAGELAARRRLAEREAGGFPGQHDAGKSLVPSGIDHVEIHSAEPDGADRQHAQVVLRALVGPAALAVSGGLVGKPHVGRGAQIDGSPAMEDLTQIHIERGRLDRLSARRGEENPQLPDTGLKPELLEQHLQPAGKFQLPLPRRQRELRTAVTGGDRFVAGRRQSHLLAVHRDPPVGEPGTRKGHGQRNGIEFGRLAETDVGGIAQRFRRISLQRNGQCPGRKLGQPGELQFGAAGPFPASVFDHSKLRPGLGEPVPAFVEKRHLEFAAVGGERPVFCQFDGGIRRQSPAEKQSGGAPVGPVHKASSSNWS